MTNMRRRTKKQMKRDRRKRPKPTRRTTTDAKHKPTTRTNETTAYAVEEKNAATRNGRNQHQARTEDKGKRNRREQPAALASIDWVPPPADKLHFGCLGGDEEGRVISVRWIISTPHITSLLSLLGKCLPECEALRKHPENRHDPRIRVTNRYKSYAIPAQTLIPGKRGKKRFTLILDSPHI